MLSAMQERGMVNIYSRARRCPAGILHSLTLEVTVFHTHLEARQSVAPQNPTGVIGRNSSSSPDSRHLVRETNPVPHCQGNPNQHHNPGNQGEVRQPVLRHACRAMLSVRDIWQMCFLAGIHVVEEHQTGEEGIS